MNAAMPIVANEPAESHQFLGGFNPISEELDKGLQNPLFGGSVMAAALNSHPEASVSSAHAGGMVEHRRLLTSDCRDLLGTVSRVLKNHTELVFNFSHGQDTLRLKDEESWRDIAGDDSGSILVRALASQFAEQAFLLTPVQSPTYDVRVMPQGSKFTTKPCEAGVLYIGEVASASGELTVVHKSGPNTESVTKVPLGECLQVPSFAQAEHTGRGGVPGYFSPLPRRRKAA